MVSWFLAWIKKYWLSHAATIGSLVVFLTPSIQAYIGAHPNGSLAAMLTIVLIAFHSRAPKDK